MEYIHEYKNINNMTEKELEIFAEDPTKYFIQQLRNALMFDPLLTKCYMIYANLYKCTEPFDHKDFLTFLAYQALLSNSINMKQLIKDNLKLEIPEEYKK